MKIRILCVGKVKEGFYRRLIEEYSTSIRKRCSFEILEVEDEKTAEHMSEAERRKLLEVEGDRLLKYLDRNPKELVAALCIEGKMYSSQDWSSLIREQIRQKEIQQITYIIGGSLGLDARVVRRADLTLSFSRLTFPHQLMRVLLAEQIACHYL